MAEQALQIPVLYDKSILCLQLDICKGVTGKLRKFVEFYLFDADIYSLDDVNVQEIYLYKQYIKRQLSLSVQQRNYYNNLLEQVLLSYLVSKHPALEEQIKEIPGQRAIKNKTLLFLLINGITDADGITYELRSRYSEYLSEVKKMEHIKVLDLLKLKSIEEHNKSNPILRPKLSYKDCKVFLLYWPIYEIAKTFYYVQDKEELLFDFTLPAFPIMKRQIFSMLNYVLCEKKNFHDRRERFLVPLKMLYLFCIQEGIEDIEQLDEDQVNLFRSSMYGRVGTKMDTYMQIIDNICKYLFISAKQINWNANTWYMEKFHFAEERTNPARIIKSLTFGKIKNQENRDIFKMYMKYQLGVSRCSLQTIRCRFYDINSFLQYLDNKNIKVESITGEEMIDFIKHVQKKELQIESFNQSIISVAELYGYLRSKEIVSSLSVDFSNYYIKTFPRHNNRYVSKETQMQILQKLELFPIHLRLMFLNLWCIGLRVSEVCILKGDAYSSDYDDTWVKVRQIKLKSWKYVPIPKNLYLLMNDYIRQNHIGANEYIFKSEKGGAYDASTFCKQVNKYLEKADVNDYAFRSHDFRHTVGTSLYNQGTSIEVIRDYLGHKDSDMTKQYLDYIPEIIDELNEQYFATEEDPLFMFIKKGYRNGK